MALKWVAQVRLVNNVPTITLPDGTSSVWGGASEGSWVAMNDAGAMWLAATAELVTMIDSARAAARAFENKPHLGQTVEWTSQAGGWTKTKRGTIVAIVPAGRKPSECLYGDHYRVDAYGSLGRNHESYLVQVGSSRRLYWPLVAKLQVAQELRLPDGQTKAVLE